MRQGKRQQNLRPLRPSNSDDDSAANVAERQMAIKQALFTQASILGENAPVGMVCVFIYQDGRTSTMLTNIEPEHLPMLLKASARLRQKIKEFFTQVKKNTADIHLFKPPK